MKQVLLLAFAGVLFSFVIPAIELPIGSSIPSPADKMADASTGKSYSFNDVKKKNGLLVVFSCNTCPFVIKNQGVATEGYSYALSKDVGVIVLNSNEKSRDGAESKSAMATYATDQKYAWPYVLDADNKMADAFGAKVTPECYLFDKNMKLVYHGAITDNPKNPDETTRAHLKQAIDDITGGKSVSVTTSKAMGCGIKRK